MYICHKLSKRHLTALLYFSFRLSICLQINFCVSITKSEQLIISNMSNSINDSRATLSPAILQSNDSPAEQSTASHTINWMIDDAKINGEKGVAIRAIAKFPQHFRGNYKANHIKATRWWKGANQFKKMLKENPRCMSIQHRQNGGRVKVQLKVFPGRG